MKIIITTDDYTAAHCINNATRRFVKAFIKEHKFLNWGDYKDSNKVKENAYFQY
jgi:hypothetical protein